MILVMAVQERGPWIIGDEVHLHRAEPRHVDRVLHLACGPGTLELYVNVSITFPGASSGRNGAIRSE